MDILLVLIVGWVVIFIVRLFRPPLKLTPTMRKGEMTWHDSHAGEY